MSSHTKLFYYNLNFSVIRSFGTIYYIQKCINNYGCLYLFAFCHLYHHSHCHHRRRRYRHLRHFCRLYYRRRCHCCRLYYRRRRHFCRFIIAVTVIIINVVCTCKTTHL